MKNTFSQATRTSRIVWKKLLGAAALGAMMLAPTVVGSTPAMADRDDHRNGYRRDDDYRNRDYRNRNNDYRGNDYRGNDYRNNSYRDTRTYEGVVTNDQAGRDFVLRLDNGQRVQVRSEDREPRRLSSGDRVRVSGYFLRTGERDRNNTRYNDNVLFYATNVQVIRNNNRYDSGYGNDRRTVSGVVTNVRSDRRLTVRIDGRDYDVESAWKLNDNIRRGSRVQVNGIWRGGDITSAIVVADKNYNDRYDRGSYGNGRYDNNYGSNSNFEFNGRVLDVDKDNRTLRVRGDNGREYSLRVDDRDELDGVRRDDRVRVRGYTRNGITVVDDVDKI